MYALPMLDQEEEEKRRRLNMAGMRSPSDMLQNAPQTVNSDAKQDQLRMFLEQLQQRAPGQQFTGRTAELMQHLLKERASQAPEMPQEAPEQAPVVAEQASAPLQPPQPLPGNSLRSHIGDRGDAISALQQEAVPGAAGQRSQPVQALSPPMPVPVAAQVPSTGGMQSLGANLFGGDFRDRLSDMFAGMAAGRNMNDSMRLAGVAMASGNKQRRQEQKALVEANKTRQAAFKMGIPAEIAANAPIELLVQMMQEQYKSQNTPIKLGEGETLFDPKTRQPMMQGGQKQTDDLREYEFAKSQGFAGSFADYQKEMKKAGATQVNVGPQGIDYGPPPKDTAWQRNADGSMVLDERGVPIAIPVQGGEKYIEQQAAEKKKVEGQQTRSKYLNVVIQDIDRAADIARASPLRTTGVGGQLLSGIGGTEAHNLGNLVETIVANVGFDRLQEMRQASPTGGALGQVSDFENRLLQSVLGSLRQSQDADQFIKNLERVKQTMLQIVHHGIPDPSAAPQSPQPDQRPRRRYNQETGEFEEVQ